MIKRLVYLLLVSGALMLAGCDSVDEDPVNVTVNVVDAQENDTELEKLTNNVGYYYGVKPNLTLKDFSYRAAGQYCIFPMTEKRKKELDQLASQEGSRVENAGDYFLITRDRDFITADDYVSERYFAGYYYDYSTQTTHDYVVVCPMIGVCVYNTETKDKILRDYKGKLTLADHEQGEKTVGDCYIYYFDCHLGTSEQVLNLSNKIYLRNDVKWAQPDMYTPWHSISSDNSSLIEFVKKAVAIMDAYGLFATGTSWENAKAEALASDPPTFEDAQVVIRKALAVAGGKHSFLTVNNSNDMSHTLQQAAMPTITQREDGILVIKLPQFSGTGEESIQYAQKVLDAIPSQLRGVVIDLIDNRGGNMYPMLAAVHRFFPEENLFDFHYRDYNYTVTVSYVINSVNIKRKDYISCPVAILMNNHTASSGEMVLLAFRGLNNVRTFGTHSAGYTTGNQTYYLPFNSKLVLTTSSVITRTGEEFCNDYIYPDVNPITPFPLDEAIKWINQQ